VLRQTDADVDAPDVRGLLEEGLVVGSGEDAVEPVHERLLEPFDLLLVGFNFDPDPDEAQLFSSLGAAAGGFNGGQFVNSQADQLWSQAAATLDRTKRKQIYKQLQNLYADLSPMPILVFQKGLWAASKRVQGLSIGPYNQFDNRSFFKDLWVSDQT